MKEDLKLLNHWTECFSQGKGSGCITEGGSVTRRSGKGKRKKGRKDMKKGLTHEEKKSQVGLIVSHQWVREEREDQNEEYMTIVISTHYNFSSITTSHKTANTFVNAFMSFRSITRRRRGGGRRRNKWKRRIIILLSCLKTRKIDWWQMLCLSSFDLLPVFVSSLDIQSSKDLIKRNVNKNQCLNQSCNKW